MHRYLYMALEVIVLATMVSCRHAEVKYSTDAVVDRASIPVLDTRDVVTLISDSGVTRYRITTPRWQIFDKAKPAYWLFPEGIYLEKFDPDFSVDAQLMADSAYYNTDDQIWHLVGHVHALNLEGEKFDSPFMQWSQKEELITSDSAITITRETSIIHGIGFRSNQEMTRYSILRPTGIIPIKDEN